MNKLKMSKEIMAAVDAGIKTATTRKGLKSEYTLGPVKFINSSNPKDVIERGGEEIFKIEAISFCDLDGELANLEGFKTLEDFKAKLVEIYGPIGACETMTVIYWER